MAKAKHTKEWVVRRVVEELYAVDAASRAEAIKIASDSDGPFSVKVLKETAKISRQREHGEETQAEQDQ